jgi:hypothetical protein
MPDVSATTPTTAWSRALFRTSPAVLSIRIALDPDHRQNQNGRHAAM